MPTIVVYGLILVAVALPVMFRKSLAARICGVVILCVLALLHATFLVAAHRMVLEAGLSELPEGSDELPDGYLVAVERVKEFSQSELTLFMALVAAFVCLSLLPRTSDKMK